MTLSYSDAIKMNSLLEDKRNLHEERDRIELAIVNEMLGKKLGHREKLDSEHRQKALLDRYMKCSKSLLALYQQDQSRRCDDDQPSNRNVFKEFYAALKDIKDLYIGRTNEQVTTMAFEFEELEAARLIALGIKPKLAHQASNPDQDKSQSDADDDELDEPSKEDEVMRLTKGLPTTDLVEVVEEQPAPVVAKPEKLVEFTDEEGYGRYLDLNKCHLAYLQVLKHEENKPSYLIFLDKFDDFSQLNRERKLTSLYKSYINVMLDYFRDYSRRAKPLFDYEHAEQTVHETFVKDWNNKTLPNWFTETDRASHVGNPMIDLMNYKSHQELVELGLDCLKRELQARGLKCGGTLEDRAMRLWSVRGISESDIDSSLRANIVVGKKGKRNNIDPFYIASIEAKLIMYADYYNDIRQATIENVQRKQARTAEERNESDDDVSDVEEEDNNQGDVIYNPKNLPLGWDGKPIPYWLYKLHGLNLTYTCEICGNATYKGPKTFQRHFAEWRHAHGMRCLGIPNTAHFANVTNIQDAIKLWEKLKNEKQKDKFQPANEEEYEDSQGNVLNKKTYEDLKRQGLL